MAVTLPFTWYAETVCLALELLIVAEARTSSGTVSFIRMVPAVKHSITPISRTDALVPTGTGKLIGGTVKLTVFLIGAIQTVLVSITHV